MPLTCLLSTTNVFLQLKAHNSTPITDNSRLCLSENTALVSSGSGSHSRRKNNCCARS